MLYLLKYILIGVVNTLLHMAIFFVLHYIFSINQAKSNFLAFLVAVNLSYCLNSKYNFKSQYSLKKHMLFMLFMGSISYGVGFVSDYNCVNPYMTVIYFMFVSLFLGFILSKYFLFKE